MTPTQFDALLSAITSGFAAIQTRLDRMESARAASEPIEPFNAAQDASEAEKQEPIQP